MLKLYRGFGLPEMLPFIGDRNRAIWLDDTSYRDLGLVNAERKEFPVESLTVEELLSATPLFLQALNRLIEERR